MINIQKSDIREYLESFLRKYVSNTFRPNGLSEGGFNDSEISRAADPCQAPTAWVLWGTVLGHFIRCQKSGGSRFGEIRFKMLLLALYGSNSVNLGHTFIPWFLKVLPMIDSTTKLLCLVLVSGAQTGNRYIYVLYKPPKSSFSHSNMTSSSIWTRVKKVPGPIDKKLKSV